MWHVLNPRFPSVFQLNNSLDVTLQAPTGASNISLSANGWLAKTRAEIKTDFKKIKKEIDANYRDSVEVLDEVAKKLFTLYGLLGTSTDTIYTVLSVWDGSRIRHLRRPSPANFT